ncbi:hypothetical protein [Pseudidiomarina taiwanensis]|uniref:Adhesin domain-containing protein n=1 Tax=Pseudidiomarina taiwanensis TaxID=337250 RepID=A0A432ZMA5_9GAMM|nr:hypothetical protein [Pseudidiomarina taiwanensis]RUO79004.1 hypothetical protein CWI83_00325 [Pseudidiomarina taiwanensis]
MQFPKSAYLLLFLICLLLKPSLTYSGQVFSRTYESEPTQSVQLNLAILVGTITIKEWSSDYVKINSVIPRELNGETFTQRGNLISFADARLTPKIKREFYPIKLEVFVPSGTNLIISGYDIDLHITGGVDTLIADVLDLNLSADGGLTSIDIDTTTFAGHVKGATGVLGLKSETLSIMISNSTFKDISLRADSVEVDVDSISANKFLLKAGTGRAKMLFDDIDSAFVDIDRGTIAVTLTDSLVENFRIESKLANIYVSLTEHIFESIELSAESFNIINILGDAELLELIDFNRDRSHAFKESPGLNSPKINAQTVKGRIDLQLTKQAD